jgi:hypothetical protein
MRPYTDKARRQKYTGLLSLRAGFFSSNVLKKFANPGPFHRDREKTR